MTDTQTSKVQDVIDHVKNMAEKYDFTPDANTAMDAISDSTDALGISLSDTERQDVYNELT